MTLNHPGTGGELTARHIVNTWRESALAELIFSYGEERWARRIARAIIHTRVRQPINTTGQLVAVIEQVVRRSRHGGRIHPATRTFQALRIAVNDELGALRDGLTKGFACLTPGGRMAVIAFHSLEDRIVKQFFKDMQAQHGAIILTKKPLTPAAGERQENMRSRSAKLRMLRKRDTTGPTMP